MTASPAVVMRRAVDVHLRLTEAGIDSAIGGALALGYHIDDPRGTQDIDVNVSVSADRARDALAALPPDVPWDEHTVARIERDDQVRIMWPDGDDLPVPLDLFFAVSPLHELVRSRSVEVLMMGHRVRVLSATDLTIFKALFDRGKDWIDIEAMLDAHDSSVDVAEAASWLESIVGRDDQRYEKLTRLGRKRDRRVL